MVEVTPVSYTHLDVYKRQVAWCDRERDIERESVERYCERKREIEIFKMSRKYEEFMEKLGGEMMYNKSKYLPCNET